MIFKANKDLIFYLILNTCLIHSDVKCSQESDEKSVYCNQVLRESDFRFNETVEWNNDLTQRIVYVGKHDKCLLSSKQPLRVHLPRLKRVSDIGLSTQLIRDQNALARLVVRIVRHNASNSTLKTFCVRDLPDTGFNYYICNENITDITRRGALVDTVEIETIQNENPVALHLNAVKNLPCMMTIRKNHEYHHTYEEQCLQPGRYATQTLDKKNSFFRFNDTVTYCCSNGTCSGQRYCTRNGWSGSPPRCLPTDAIPVSKAIEKRLEIFPLGTHETVSYYIDEEYPVITSIKIDKQKQICDECYINDGTNGFTRVATIFEIVGNNKSTNWTLASRDDLNGGNCRLTFKPMPSVSEPVICKDCEIKQKYVLNVQLGASLPQMSIGKLTVTGWKHADYETYKWMATGCSPIDPYVGMPAEYADAEILIQNPDTLNEKLREAPCKDGYRLGRYDLNNPRRCQENSWTGDIPQCKLKTCRTPPSIQNGHWTFLGDMVYHKVQYQCHDLFVLSGDGIAICDDELNTWEGVPACLLKPNIISNSSVSNQEDDMETYTATPKEPAENSTNHLSTAIAVGVVALVLILIIVLVSGYLLCRNKENNTEAGTVSTKAKRADEEADLMHFNTSQETATASAIPRNYLQYDAGGYLQPLNVSSGHDAHLYSELIEVPTN